MSATAKGLSPAHIRASIDGSLKRLRTDYIDLYQSHVDDPDADMEATLATYGELITAGKVRAIGASNFTVPRFQQALDISATKNLPRYESLQPLYNLYDRKTFETEFQALCSTQTIGVIPYYALGAGFLTGKYRSEKDFSKSARGGGMTKYLNPRGLAILAALDAVAARQKATPAQVAVAWLIAQPTIAAPIASATSTAQLGDLLAAAKLTLTADDFAALDRASA